MRALEPYLPERCSSVSFGAGRRRLLMLAAAATLLTAISVWVVARDQPAGWFGALFFGLGLAVFLLQMVPGVSGLRLDAEGFHTRSLFSEWTIRWSDVREFRANERWRRLLAFPASGYLLRDESPLSSRVFSVLRFVTGVDGGLYDDYGFRRDDLVRLLNAWRKFHAGEGAVPPAHERC